MAALVKQLRSADTFIVSSFFDHFQKFVRFSIIAFLWPKKKLQKSYVAVILYLICKKYKHPRNYSMQTAGPIGIKHGRGHGKVETFDIAP